MVKSGKLSAKKEGGVWIFDRAEVEDIGSHQTAGDGLRSSGKSENK
jgi:hypothetical protein